MEERAEEVKKTISLSDIPRREALTKMMEEHNKRVIQSLKETSKQIEEEVSKSFWCFILKEFFFASIVTGFEFTSISIS